MKGWDFTKAEIEAALRDEKILNPSYELAGNACALNCFFCFTEDPDNPDGAKRRLSEEMDLNTKMRLIDETAELGGRAINIVGAGEPLIDRDFWTIVERIAAHGMVPIVYTEGTAAGKERRGLHNPDNAQRLYDIGATVVLKVNSLRDRAYQNGIVFNTVDPEGWRFDYFGLRGQVLETLIDAGFNRGNPTRLAFDTIMCEQNYGEIPGIHRFARDNNIFVLLVNYLPSGRSSSPVQGAITHEQQLAMYAQLATMDREQYGIQHGSQFPYGGGMPCSLRGLGLHVTIRGQVWDCAGELEKLGDFKTEPLSVIWGRTKHIRDTFDGGCAPRDAFWERYDGAEQGAYVRGPFVPVERLLTKR